MCRQWRPVGSPASKELQNNAYPESAISQKLKVFQMFYGHTM